MKRFENFEIFAVEQLRDCLLSSKFVPDNDLEMSSSFMMRAELLIEIISHIRNSKIHNSTFKYSFEVFEVAELEEIRNCIIHTTSLCDDETAKYRAEMLIKIQQQIEAEIEDDPEMQDAAYDGLAN